MIGEGEFQRAGTTSGTNPSTGRAACTPGIPARQARDDHSSFHHGDRTAARPWKLVERLIRTGRYTDEGDVIREALRALERQELDESPALEAAVLEGVGSPHLPYDDTVLERIRRNARSQA